MSVKLKTINRVLGWFGLLLIVTMPVENDSPHDTVLTLTTRRRWTRRWGKRMRVTTGPDPKEWKP